MFALVQEPIDARALCAGMQSSHGAAVTFEGVVRDRADDGRAVTELVYEAYEPLALREFHAIGDEARREFGIAEISIVHRIGELVPGDVAVAVCVTSEHRAQAFEACRYAIEELKRRAPIWKSERYAGGKRLWKTNAPAAGTHSGSAH